MSFQSTRRDLLKAVGTGAGAVLLAPLMDQIAAQAAGEIIKKKRVIFVMQSNGIHPHHFYPTDVERPKHGKLINDTLETVSLQDRKLHPAIEALSPFKDRMALVHGLSGRIAVSDHSANHGALGACPANKGPMSQTIDSAISEALPGTFSHVAIGYGGDNEAMSYAYCASGPGKAVPIICSPDLAFKSLFGSVAEGAGRAAFDRRTNLLDFMASDVRRLQGELVGDERQKLDQYLEAFESLHQRQKELLAKSDDLKQHAPKLGDKLTSRTSSLILEAQFEIAAAALISGLTNVVTLTSGGGGQRFGNFQEFGIPDLHHIGHGGSYGDRNYEQCFVELRQFHAKLIAGLATKLQNVREGDGTMLDNSVIVYLSDSGEGHHPALYEWPVMLLGNLGGTLKTDGHWYCFPRYGAKEHRTMANLYGTLLHAVGKPRDKFGVPDVGLKDIDQTGPVGQLLA